MMMCVFLFFWVFMYGSQSNCQPAHQSVVNDDDDEWWWLWGRFRRRRIRMMMMMMMDMN